jgi:conjugal transfer pilin signal peptidase TrbI
MDRATEERTIRWRYAAIALLAAGLAGTQALASWRDSHLVLINATLSLENWAFLVERGTKPRRGDIAFFVAPPNRIVTEHFGIPTPPFGKRVYGIAGDRVRREGDVVSVNGRPVARLKPLTKSGERLTPGPTGIIPQGCYYMGSPHKDGLDSRYADIGFVCHKQILGTGRAIL